MVAIAKNPWVMIPRPKPQARLRLFCFPHAGGAASAFYTWSDGLPRDIEVCPVQLSGRESRLGEPLYTRLDALLPAVLQGIQPYLDKPFVFFGHSMGAKISFELARELRKRSGPMPLCLFVSGSRAPQITERDPIHHLPEAEFVEKIRRFNGTPEIVLQNAELMELFLPILRADHAIDETYVYTPGDPLDCPILALGGEQDTGVTREDLIAWREMTRGAFSLTMFPGDHFFIRPAQALILKVIGQELTQLLVRLAQGRPGW